MHSNSFLVGCWFFFFSFSSTACWRCPWSQQGFGLHDLWGSSPTQTILWFCYCLSLLPYLQASKQNTRAISVTSPGLAASHFVTLLFLWFLAVPPIMKCFSNVCRHWSLEVLGRSRFCCKGKLTTACISERILTPNPSSLLRTLSV